MRRRILVLLAVVVMMVAMLAMGVAPALAQNEFFVNDRGVVSIGGDLVVGNCSDLLQEREEIRRHSPDLVGAIRACERAGYSASPTNTGGPATASASPTAASDQYKKKTAAAVSAQYKTVTGLPGTGGAVPSSGALALGAGALLVGGGLLARRIIR
jgi:hypothetical protein